VLYEEFYGSVVWGARVLLELFYSAKAFLAFVWQNKEITQVFWLRARAREALADNRNPFFWGRGNPPL
jgi:hypothetical protein